MKSSLIVSCMFLFTILTQPVVAQQSGISIHMVDVTLEAVLNEIEAKSNYYFLYNQKLIDTDQKVSIHMENASVDEGLKDVFQDLNIRYLVYGQQIILLPKEIDDEIVIADQRRVTGTILDAMTGEPLAGVNIRIAGTNIGAIADREGRYNLTVPGSNVSLVFSYIGYRTEAASVGERYVINIELLPAVETIEEIIVVGYGVQDKSVVTGAISKLESRQLENTSIMRAEQALKGRLSGIQVISNSGAPGAKLKLRIRGYGSNGVSDPLFIVDGLRNNNIDYLNPDDIASIEILKDAASAAIYGSEGANGVVLITTKRGSAGKSSLSYNFQQGWQSLIKKPELMNASKFSEYMEEAGLISGEPVDTDTDWIGEVFETSPYTKHHVSLSGGGNDITFLLSLAYLNQDGIVITSKDKFDRYNLMFNSDYRIFPWLKIGNNISYAHTTLREVSENSEYGSVITNALMMDPLTPVRYDQYIPLNIKALLDDG
ncbi:MAG: TonB-dependent receptor plug domain-containing protein, partial [Bacteroidales bacterium]|nr:TonB-dependent receptor plug domain-containing protein [Bacteroidales bacterium]